MPCPPQLPVRPCGSTVRFDRAFSLSFLMSSERKFVDAGDTSRDAHLGEGLVYRRWRSFAGEMGPSEPFSQAFGRNRSEDASGTVKSVIGAKQCDVSGCGKVRVGGAMACKAQRLYRRHPAGGGHGIHHRQAHETRFAGKLPRGHWGPNVTLCVMDGLRGVEMRERLSMLADAHQ